MEPDFSGWATKAGLKCTDGRTIMPDAFKHQDQMTVPLVWMHGHNTPDNVLGHAVLENRPEGVYARGFFNDTPSGKQGKALVHHRDVKFLSIWANQLVERAKQVFHGSIKEVSLVLAGANPGAEIDYVSIAHGDDIEQLKDEAIIHTGLEIVEGDEPSEKSPDEAVVEDESKVDETTDEGDAIQHAADSTVQEVYDAMSQEQKDVVHYMLGEALAGAAAKHADPKDEGDLEHNQEGQEMTRNVFEQRDGGSGDTKEKHVLSHDDMRSIMTSAVKTGSLKTAVEDYALAHGIDDIDVLFPEARLVTTTPDFDKRRTEWVAGVLNGVRKSPFSRIKTISADITHAEARAKGYIKGTLKKEEFFQVFKRTTTPTTVYKKQKLDRDDIIDITDFDVVAWMKGEMRLMLEEEVARAILIGDGRDVSDDDKIKDPAGASSGDGVRSILNDDELYVATYNVNLLDASSTYSELVDGVLDSMRFYKGTPGPSFYTTLPTITKMLLLRDQFGKRLYRTVSDLAAEMGVSSIVAVEVMEDLTDGTLGIVVNLSDYTVGADRGGDISLFDFFDIDFNQYKYLIETRMSGALTKIRSAIKIVGVASTKALVDPITAPTFVPATGVVTIPTQTGVVYKNSDTSATLSAGAQTALASGATLNVIATADSTHYFKTNVEDQWSFTRP